MKYLSISILLVSLVSAATARSEASEVNDLMLSEDFVKRDVSAYPYTTSYWTSTIAGKPSVYSTVGTSYSTIEVTSSYSSETGGIIIIGPGFFTSNNPEPTATETASSTELTSAREANSASIPQSHQPSLVGETHDSRSRDHSQSPLSSNGASAPVKVSSLASAFPETSAFYPSATGVNSRIQSTSSKTQSPPSTATSRRPKSSTLNVSSSVVESPLPYVAGRHSTGLESTVSARHSRSGTFRASQSSDLVYKESAPASSESIKSGMRGQSSSCNQKSTRSSTTSSQPTITARSKLPVTSSGSFVTLTMSRQSTAIRHVSSRLQASTIGPPSSGAPASVTQLTERTRDVSRMGRSSQLGTISHGVQATSNAVRSLSLRPLSSLQTSDSKGSSIRSSIYTAGGKSQGINTLETLSRLRRATSVVTHRALSTSKERASIGNVPYANTSRVPTASSKHHTTVFRSESEQTLQHSDSVSSRRLDQSMPPSQVTPILGSSTGLHAANRKSSFDRAQSRLGVSTRASFREPTRLTLSTLSMTVQNDSPSPLASSTAAKLTMTPSSKQRAISSNTNAQVTSRIHPSITFSNGNPKSGSLSVEVSTRTSRTQGAGDRVSSIRETANPTSLARGNDQSQTAGSSNSQSLTPQISPSTRLPMISATSSMGSEPFRATSLSAKSSTHFFRSQVIASAAFPSAYTDSSISVSSGSALKTRGSDKSTISHRGQTAFHVATLIPSHSIATTVAHSKRKSLPPVSEASANPRSSVTEASAGKSDVSENSSQNTRFTPSSRKHETKTSLTTDSSGEGSSIKFGVSSNTAPKTQEASSDHPESTKSLSWRPSITTSSLRTRYSGSLDSQVIPNEMSTIVTASSSVERSLHSNKNTLTSSNLLWPSLSDSTATLSTFSTRDDDFSSTLGHANFQSGTVHPRPSAPSISGKIQSSVLNFPLTDHSPEPASSKPTHINAVQSTTSSLGSTTYSAVQLSDHSSSTTLVTELTKSEVETVSGTLHTTTLVQSTTIVAPCLSTSAAETDASSVISDTSSRQLYSSSAFVSALSSFDQSLIYETDAKTLPLPETASKSAHGRASSAYAVGTTYTGASEKTANVLSSESTTRQKIPLDTSSRRLFTDASSHPTSVRNAAPRSTNIAQGGQMLHSLSQASNEPPILGIGSVALTSLTMPSVTVSGDVIPTVGSVITADSVHSSGSTDLEAKKSTALRSSPSSAVYTEANGETKPPSSSSSGPPQAPVIDPSSKKGLYEPQTSENLDAMTSSTSFLQVSAKTSSPASTNSLVSSPTPTTKPSEGSYSPSKSSESAPPTINGVVNTAKASLMALCVPFVVSLLI